MPRNSKVFVVQETEHNILPAKEFGELEILLSTRDVMRGLEHYADKLAERLGEWRECDFLLCIGDPVAIGLAIHMVILATREGASVNILKWDRIHYQYKVETINPRNVEL